MLHTIYYTYKSPRVHTTCKIYKKFIPRVKNVYQRTLKGNLYIIDLPSTLPNQNMQFRHLDSSADLTSSRCIRTAVFQY